MDNFYMGELYLWRKRKWSCVSFGYLFVVLFVNSWTSLKLFSYFKIEIKKNALFFPHNLRDKPE